MISLDTYLQPDAPDPVLDPATVLQLARRHAPEVGEVQAVDESGGEARTYLLDGDLVLKTQRPHRLRPRTSLAKETFILQRIAEHSDLPVPRVVGHGTEGPIEYILMTRMPGLAVRNAELPEPARAQLLGRLGAVLHGLHGLDQSAFASDVIPGDRSADDLRARLRGIFDRLEPAVTEMAGWPAELAPSSLVEGLLQDIPDAAPLVVLHSNPGPEHTFVDPATSQFTGIIDFGDAYRSHPALDLRSWLEPADAQALLAGYRAAGPPPPGFDAVWRCGRVMMEMALATRGRRDVPTATANIRSALA